MLCGQGRLRLPARAGLHRAFIRRRFAACLGRIALIVALIGFTLDPALDRDNILGLPAVS